MDEARKLVGFKNAWSSQCIVYALANGQKVAIRSPKDLDYVHSVMSKSKPNSAIGERSPLLSNHDLDNISTESQMNHSVRDSVIDTLKHITTSNTINNNVVPNDLTSD